MGYVLLGVLFDFPCSKDSALIPYPNQQTNQSIIFFHVPYSSKEALRGLRRAPNSRVGPLATSGINREIYSSHTSTPVQAPRKTNGGPTWCCRDAAPISVGRGESSGLGQKLPSLDRSFDTLILTKTVSPGPASAAGVGRSPASLGRSSSAILKPSLGDHFAFPSTRCFTSISTESATVFFLWRNSSAISAEILHSFRSCLVILNSPRSK